MGGAVAQSARPGRVRGHQAAPRSRCGGTRRRQLEFLGGQHLLAAGWPGRADLDAGNARDTAHAIPVSALRTARAAAAELPDRYPNAGTGKTIASCATG